MVRLCLSELCCVRVQRFFRTEVNIGPLWLRLMQSIDIGEKNEIAMSVHCQRKRY